MSTKGSSLQLYVDAHDIGNGYNGQHKEYRIRGLGLP